MSIGIDLTRTKNSFREASVVTTLNTIILAAGQGSRMKSSLPKVLHKIAGKPMVQWVIDAAGQLPANNAHVVIGHGADHLKEALSGQPLTFAVQAEQLGTGHAVAQAMPNIAEDSIALVLYGDVPLTKAETMARLVEIAEQGDFALLTVKLDDPTGYGRIVRDEQARVSAIVEHKDATADQLAITEVNTGILAVAASKLHEWLPQLSSDNAQGEYYLTDVIAMAASSGMTITTMQPDTEQEVQGINNRMQQAELERWYQQQQARSLMEQGVTLADPARLDVRGDLTVGTDVSIDINVVFKGKVVLGNNVTIEPNCVIEDSVIGDGCHIKANSVLEQAELAGDSDIGPFARLRPGSRLALGAKVGNFVETKKANIGAGSKVNHLSYVGDAEVGPGANIGAGTITCNYDGVNKFKTEIGAGAFIGSNSALVAPVKIGENATVGAGSTVSKNVNDAELAVSRARQTNIKGWQRPVDQKAAKDQ